MDEVCYPLEEASEVDVCRDGVAGYLLFRLSSTGILAYHAMVELLEDPSSLAVQRTI